MKYLSSLALVIIFAATTAFAITSEFVVNTITAYPGATYGSGLQLATVPVTYNTPLIVNASAACTMYDTTVTANEGIPLAANTHYKFQPTRNTNYLFTCASTATAATISTVK